MSTTAFFSFLPAAVENVGHDVLFIVGGIMALLGLYATLRSQAPKAAKVMAWPFRAFWVTAVALAHVPRWFWRQLWRDATGVSRGPIVRLLERRAVWMTSVITETVGPMIDTVRENAKAQHDEQNEKIDAQLITMTERFDAVTERLDKGSGVMLEHGEAIAAIQAALIRDPNERTRSTDPEQGGTT